MATSEHRRKIDEHRDEQYKKLLATIKQYLVARLLYEENCPDWAAPVIVNSSIEALHDIDEQKEDTRLAKIDEQLFIRRYFLAKRESDELRRRKHRLLAGSIVIIAMTKAGFVPEAIPFFGINFGATDTRNLLLILGAILAYFLAGFWICAWAEGFEVQNEEMERLFLRWIGAPKVTKSAARYWSFIKRLFKEHWNIFLIALVRWAYDFWLPVLVALFAFWCILTDLWFP